MSKITRTTKYARLGLEALEDRQLMSASPMTSIAAGHHGDAFGLDARGHVYQDVRQAGWQDIHVTGKAIAVGTDAAGRDEVYIQGGDNLVSRYDNGVLTSTGGHLASFQAGHGEVVGLDAKGGLWSYDDKAGWKSTGKSGTAFSVGTDAAGRDEVFLQGLDGKLGRYDNGVLTSTGGHLASFQAGHGGVVGLDAKGEVWRFDDKTGWADQHVKASAVSVGTDATGHDQLFMVPNLTPSGGFKPAGDAVGGLGSGWLYHTSGTVDYQYVEWFYYDAGSNQLYKYGVLNGVDPWSAVASITPMNDGTVTVDYLANGWLDTYVSLRQYVG